MFCVQAASAASVSAPVRKAWPISTIHTSPKPVRPIWSGPFKEKYSLPREAALPAALFRRLFERVGLPAQHRLSCRGGFVQAAAGRQARGAFETGGLSRLGFQRHGPQHMNEAVEG